MVESFHELEAELKALRPQQPSPLLHERIDSELSARIGAAVAGNPRYIAATNLNSWKWFGWRSAGVVAAIALMATLGWMNSPVAPAPDPVPPRLQLARNAPVLPASGGYQADRDRYQPVAATNVLYDLKDEGRVIVDGDTPARRLRYRYVDTYTWKNPRNNALLKWSVPRDEIRVLPASLN